MSAHLQRSADRPVGPDGGLRDVECPPYAAVASQQSPKRLSKSLIENRIDYRIDRARNVSEPKERGGQEGRHGLTEVAAECDGEIESEKRSPAYEEAGEDHAEHSGRLLLIGDVLGGGRAFGEIEESRCSLFKFTS